MDRSTYPVRKLTLADEEREDAVRSMTPAERIAMVWQLTCQAWMFREGQLVEPRLRRHVVRVVRGGGSLTPEDDGL